ncbi:hypothetical protein [Desulfotomaculum copahuensis]|uniref:Uncharacterized protein n=1 Tax=Desulfotomaculum copahuensis TaxID=1838280 RepID=A0A1B7LFW2_9FIRM|nr:hypothetical protein [Desulfotomaculum copahuensis]OAT83617.1 hypothetical protein A6M21_08005 [Desulfotomaculum copahuensis]
MLIVLWRGLLSGIPVGLLSALVVFLGRDNVIAGGRMVEGMAKMSGSGIVTSMMAAFGGGALVFGILSAAVYKKFFLSRFGAQAGGYFLAFALALAVVASVLAVVSKTPFAREKVIINLIYALGFGLLLPRFL